MSFTTSQQTRGRVDSPILMTLELTCLPLVVKGWGGHISLHPCHYSPTIMTSLGPTLSPVAGDKGKGEKGDLFLDNTTA